MAKKMRKQVLSASILAIAISSSPQAFAQDNAQEEASDADNVIIVTARRRDENLQDVPVVVTAITSDDVEKLNLREAKELIALVPGLDFRNNGFASSIQLRGLTFDINAGTLASVATYLNDAPINSRALFSQLYDIGQIEVLHGPQGTLRGQASPSGSITFTTKKPNLSEAGGTMSGTVTSVNSYNLNGALNIPVIEDVLGVRLAGVVDRTRGNRVRSIAPFADTSNPFAEEMGGRVSVLFKPTDWLQLEGVYQRIDFTGSQFNQYASYELVDSNALPSPVVIRPKDRLSIQERQSTNHQTFDIFNWQAQVRFAGQKLVYVGSDVSYKSFGKSNSDSANFLPNLDHGQTTEVQSPQKSHEVRIQNEDRVGGMFDYVVGYYTTKQTSNISLLIETPVLLPPFLGGGVVAVAATPINSAGPGGSAPGSSKEESFFGNVTAHIGDKLQVSGGLRRVKYTEAARFLQIGANLLPNGSAVNDKKWIYTASVQYKFTPDAMVYASTGTSRRRGPTLFQSALLQSPLQQSFVNLPSEDSESYEVGIKSAWLDNRLTFNLTAFQQKFKNYPYKLANGVYYLDYSFINGGFTPSVGNSFQYGAAVPVTIRGVEAELSYRPSDRFNVSLVAAYNDSQIKNGTIPCDDLNGDGVPDTLSAAPTVAQLQAAYGADQIGACIVSLRGSNLAPFSASAQAEYNHPVSDGVELFGRGLFSYYGSSQNDPSLTFDDIGSYGLLNLYAGVRDPGGAWEVNFFAKNVANTIRYSRFGTPANTSYQELAPPTFMTTVGKATASPYSQIDTNAPREFGVNLKIAFGSR